MQTRVLAVIRIITGVLLIYHGREVFMPDQIKVYSDWLADLHYPIPVLFAYAGKAAELIGGFSLLLGLWVRYCMVPLVATLLLITFTMGHGKIFTDDQHPFVLALLSAVFGIMGAGAWSIDTYFAEKKQRPTG